MNEKKFLIIKDVSQKFAKPTALDNITSNDSQYILDRTNKFEIRLEIIDKTTKQVVLKLFTEELYTFKYLPYQAKSLINKIQPYIDKMNNTGDFSKLDSFVYPTIKELLYDLRRPEEELNKNMKDFKMNMSNLLKQNKIR